MVDHQIDEHTNAALLRAMSELDEIADRAIARVDAVIIGHVVSLVAMGRDLERHQPDSGHAKAMQVVQPAHQSLEVADAVAVGIHVGSNGQAVDHRVLVPEVVDHRASPVGPPIDQNASIAFSLPGPGPGASASDFGRLPQISRNSFERWEPGSRSSSTAFRGWLIYLDRL